MSMAEEDIRHLIVTLLTAPTPRDAQTTIGASNLSNQCDFCLASNLTGDMRDAPALDRAWGGRVLGTSIHGLLEKRMEEAIALSSRSGILADIGKRYPDAQLEQHRKLGTIPGYGEVGTTPDLVLPSERTVVDYKSSDRKKSALMRDYISISSGQEPLFFQQQKRGNWVYKPAGDTTVAISDNDHAKEMRKQGYKVTGYYGQLNLYGWCLTNAGIPIDVAAIGWVVRDSTMWFDNPAFERYDDETRARGVWTLSFGYNESYAEALWNRGLQIWEALQNGATPQDFPRHELCYPCGLDLRSAEKAVEMNLDAPILLPAEPTLVAA